MGLHSGGEKDVKNTWNNKKHKRETHLFLCGFWFRRLNYTAKGTEFVFYFSKVKNEEKQGITRAYDKLLEENKMLKSADNKDAAEKIKSHEKPIDFLAHILYFKDEEKQYTP